MDRPPPARAATRTLAQHHDARDLRAVIVEALEATPIDEQALRDGRGPATSRSHLETC